MNTDMIKRETFTALVAQVRKSQDDFSMGIDILENAQKELGVLLGENNAHILSYGIISKEKCLDKIKGNAWGYLLHRSGVFEFCSIKQREEINRQMEDEKNLPEFTLDNIQAWFESYAVNIDKLFEDSIKEVFNWLRPWKRDFKTNNREIIGRKVIKDWMFEQSWNGRMWPIYRNESYVQALDNVFHLMDGKGVAKYPGNLVTAIRNACQAGASSCETEYFSVKWYKKGTMHLEFRRLDLLRKVNAKAGGVNLGADLFGDKQEVMKTG